jgi:hypothetical protein
MKPLDALPCHGRLESISSENVRPGPQDCVLNHFLQHSDKEKWQLFCDQVIVHIAYLYIIYIKNNRILVAGKTSIIVNNINNMVIVSDHFDHTETLFTITVGAHSDLNIPGR